MSRAQKFSDLVKRYKSGKATPEERAAIEAFLEQTGETDVFAKLPETEQQIIHDAILERLTQIVHEKPRREVFLSGVWLKAAAAIVVLAVASIIIWQWQSVETINVATLSQPKKVILPDGSIIWLKENSTMSYPDRFTGNERNISFTGDALFEIAKDASHPFSIAGKNASVKVLGTSFNLRFDSLSTELTVLTGKVALSPEGQASIVVKAHEKAIYQKSDRQLAVKPIEIEDAQSVTKGTEYNMQFDAAPLSEVVDKVQKKFDVTISLSNKRMGNCRVTADFTDQSLELTMTKISEMLGYVYDADGRRITLTGEGCN